ncbi:MAG: glycosyltransferase [bacterium]|nr:glycosyltransferase [bacterium]
MKLTIIPEGPMAFDGKDYFYSEGEGIYIDGIAKYFDEVIICAYAFHKSDLEYKMVSQYKFRSANIKFVELPMVRQANAGFISKVFQMVRVFKTISAHIKNWEIIYLFLPGYPSAIAYLINKIFRKKYFVYLASEWTEESSIMFRWQGITKKLIYPVYFWFNDWVEKSIVKGSFLILTAGRATLEKYKSYGNPIYETIPRINWSEIKLFKRDDTCQDKRIKLLFVGYLLPRKGPEYVIEVISLLKNRKKDNISLTIVGEGEQREELRELTRKLNVEDRVEFLGHLANGPGLFKVFRDSDIFILPTPFGEGFPRVLYEAMSQSIPIVTTNVSGIPYKMKHEENALLVLPRDAEAIADAVERLVNDGELRRKMISGGYKFMEQMIQNNDGGKQVNELVQKYYAGVSKS